jgi:hypothetical protein
VAVTQFKFLAKEREGGQVKMAHVLLPNRNSTALRTKSKLHVMTGKAFGLWLLCASPVELSPLATVMAI